VSKGLKKKRSMGEACGWFNMKTGIRLARVSVAGLSGCNRSTNKTRRLKGHLTKRERRNAGENTRKVILEAVLIHFNQLKPRKGKNQVRLLGSFAQRDNC